MALGVFLRSLAAGQDPWAAVKEWRRKRDEIAPPSTPTFDVYPDHVEPPSMRLYVEARDIRGRLLRQYVDLSGYSLHHVNLTSRKWRDGLLERIAEARYLLAVRLAEVELDKRSTMPPGRRRRDDR